MIFNMTGGGAGLNFTIKVYSSKELIPETAKENTIAVITTTPIDGYQFSVEQPTNPEVGCVWFLVGTASEVSFSATKKNLVMIYPMSAKQYVGGAWVDVTALSYMNGEWCDWWDYFLYKLGDEYSEITGGWTTYGNASKESSQMNLALTNTSSGRYGGAYTKKMIDLTNISSIVFKFNGTMGAGVGGTQLMIWAAISQLSATSVSPPTGAAASTKFSQTGALSEVKLNTANLTGNYYVGFHIGLGGGDGDDLENAVLLTVKSGV